MDGSGWTYLRLVDCVLHSRDTFAYLGPATQHSRRLSSATTSSTRSRGTRRRTWAGGSRPSTTSRRPRRSGVGLGSRRTTRRSGSCSGAPPAGGARPATAVPLASGRGDRQLARRALRPSSRPGSATTPSAGAIPIYVAATGPRMLELAGEVGDGALRPRGRRPEDRRLRPGADPGGRKALAAIRSASTSLASSSARSVLIPPRSASIHARTAMASLSPASRRTARLMGTNAKRVDEIRETWKRRPSSAATAARWSLMSGRLKDLNLAGLAGRGWSGASRPSSAWVPPFILRLSARP